MLGVSGIQSAIPSLGRPQATPGGGLERYGEDRNTGIAVDTYSGDSEAWRNRATTDSPVGQTACRCGNCPSCAAKAYATQGQQADIDEPGAGGESDTTDREDGLATSSAPKGVDGDVLSQQEQARLTELKKVDRAVRAHEQAHLAAAGNLARGGVSLSYEKGADGRRYAVGGEVSIDTSKEADPSDTITKMRTVRAAALAPADPSPQDRKVAAAAAATMTTAMGDLRLERAAEVSAENVASQAAEKMAGRNSENTKSQDGPPAAESDQVSPRSSRIIQRYTAGSAVQSKRLSVTA